MGSFVHFFRAVADGGGDAAYPRPVQATLPITMAHFEAGVSPEGAFLAGDPEFVARKIAAYDTKLGGLSRVTFQTSAASLPQGRLLESIRLIGSQVMPLIKKETPNLKGWTSQLSKHWTVFRLGLIL